MRIIFSKIAQNKGKLYNKRYLKSYFSILYPDKYARELTSSTNKKTLKAEKFNEIKTRINKRKADPLENEHVESEDRLLNEHSMIRPDADAV
jgi:hypothetical protein